MFLNNSVFTMPKRILASATLSFVSWGVRSEEQTQWNSQKPNAKKHNTSQIKYPFFCCLLFLLFLIIKYGKRDPVKGWSHVEVTHIMCNFAPFYIRVAFNIIIGVVLHVAHNNWSVTLWNSESSTTLQYFISGCEMKKKIK